MELTNAVRMDSVESFNGRLGKFMDSDDRWI